ncbi:MAG: hypothetical protein KDJ47_00175 [Hyphomicrobiaceae bacterium]|nr:hypothetical protein [Hyphomicrobiaceae bacterium]
MGVFIARRFPKHARWNDDDTALLAPDGSAMTLTEAAELGSNITATGTAYTGSGYFVGVLVSAYSGGPQTIVARDSTDASGRILATFTVSSVGTYRVDGDWSTPGSGGGLRIKIDAGVHLTISGGTSRTVAAIVEA